MKKLIAYLLLPKEISEFERQYLAKINRIALVFFICHVPVFVAVALLAGTSWAQAALLTSLAAVGPAVGYQTLRNPRHLSIVSGFTAMCMGGLLVHFGQGPMQIEMHFYFFTLIALLAVFANPIAILTAAVTVALHHLILYFALPSSVFNYDASIWTVAVHFAFVVLESVAACFVARSFFDNVIGLEKIVQRRTNQLSVRNHDMRMVFDNVAQGFATVNLDGTLLVERSATAVEWLGPHQEGKKLWEHVAAVDAQTATWMQLGWEALIEDVLPMEMAVDQLPKRCTSGAKTFSLEYRPVVTNGELSQVLLVMSDITAQLEREKIETEQRDFLSVFQRLLKDKKGFLEFFAEADEMVSAIVHRTGPFGDLRRYLHTLKGNCALFGLSALAAFCNELETNLLEAHGVLAAGERERLGQLWGTFAANLRTLLGTNQGDRFEIDHREYAEVLAALEGDGEREEIATRLRSWQFETAELRLGRLAEQARAIAGRLGKGPLNVVVEPNDLRLYPESWAAFWSAFTHAIRNAVDHGLESSDERLAARKPAAGELRLASKLVGPDLVIEIRDDGRGVAWDLVRERAIAAGLPHATRDDLVEALFADGVTTRREVSEFSGRGIGMGALRAVCRRMGGTMEVQSEAGQGVCLRFKWTNVHARVEALVLAPRSPLHVARHALATGEHLQ